MPTGVQVPHKAASLPVAAAPDFEALFRRLARERLPAVLDSAGGPRQLARWTVLAFDPFQVLTHADRQTTLADRDGRTHAAPDNPFTALREQLRQFHMPAVPGGAPFLPGLAIGFLGYELGRYVERLPATAVRDIGLPDMHWAFYDSLLVIDAHNGSAAVHASDVGGRDPHALLARWRTVLDGAARQGGETGKAATRAAAPGDAVGEMAFDRLEYNFTRQGYLRAVARTLDYIAAGDIFQANLSQRFTAPLACDPAELYLRLRRSNPAPFGAYLAGEGPEGDWSVLSSSPERFLRVEGRRVATRPIKGTRPRRAGDETLNARSREQLIASAKDAAELAMIVDLERNDLGRVCSFGTVRVTEPRTIEEYASVFHSVAQVEGRLHDGLDLVDLLKATFPGGSITGAPKVRAMEIIDELEPTCRSVYTGSVGWIGPDGSADLNIAIRTLIADRGRVHLQVGGGIVADSTPEDEFDETLAKARSLLEALGVSI